MAKVIGKGMVRVGVVGGSGRLPLVLGGVALTGLAVGAAGDGD